MTQKTTTTPTQTPSVKEILSTIASIEWEESGNHGEAPVPSPDDLDNPAYWNLDGIRAYVDLTPNFFQAFMSPDVITRIQKIHEIWETARETNPKIEHPLAPIIRVWQQSPRGEAIENATVDQVSRLTAIPYATSEVMRRQWEPVGSIDAIEVDGEPIVTAISKLPGPFSRDYPAKVYKPKGTQGNLRLKLPPGRDNMEIPIPLIAYERFGSDLRSALASDVAQLMSIAYTTNEPLILTVKDGASLLARSVNGKMRYSREADEQRFERAFACLHGMSGWVTDDHGIHRFYPLTTCDRFSDNRVSLAAASWARTRKAGRWTLTAGFGVAGQNRLKGNAHNNNIWRVIIGIEYYLARSPFVRGGEHKSVSQALIPVNGKTGPGPWQKLTWQGLMIISGDIWDLKDKDASSKAYKRFQKIRDSLKNRGYQTPSLNSKGSHTGDTVEFHFGRNGTVYARATARFVEGARKAQSHEWETVRLSEFLGL